MKKLELEILDNWKSDPSFINWVNKENESDIKKWDAFFEANPQYIELAELAKFSLEIKVKPIDHDQTRSLAALSMLQGKMKHSPQKSKNRIIHIRALKAWQIAASILLIIMSYWGYVMFIDKGQEVLLVTKGEKKEVLLADGTKVILNAHSTLKYFKKDVRKVQLTGEAYFEVQKQPKTKAAFQVKTEDLLVTVLGTEFNVNQKNGQTKVYLDEGSVKLNLGEKENHEIEMEPGDLVSYSQKNNKILENRKANALEATAWKEKVIAFEDASIKEVLEAISIIYDIKFESNISNEPFTGGVPVDDLDIALQTLKDIYQLNIKKIEGKYIIEN